MDNSQFASVLIKAMPSYRKYQQEFNLPITGPDYFCYVIKYKVSNSIVSPSAKNTAVNKIRKLIDPHIVLNTYLYKNYGSEGFEYLDRKCLAFWMLHIVAGKEREESLIDYYMCNLNKYLADPNEFSWNVIRALYKKYIPESKSGV